MHDNYPIKQSCEGATLAVEVLIQSFTGCHASRPIFVAVKRPYKEFNKCTKKEPSHIKLIPFTSILSNTKVQDLLQLVMFMYSTLYLSP